MTDTGENVVSAMMEEMPDCYHCGPRSKKEVRRVLAAALGQVGIRRGHPGETLIPGDAVDRLLAAAYGGPDE